MHTLVYVFYILLCSIFIYSFFCTLQMQYSRGDGGVAPKYDEGEDMVRQLQANQTGVDDKLQQAQIQLFKNQQLLLGGDHDSPTAEGEEEEEDRSGDEDSGSEESDSDAESGSDDNDEDGAGPRFNGMPQEQQEVPDSWALCGIFMQSA